ncbi:MAG: leucine-rich repeat protein [Clostridia bacterium]|nr:leucine-rich repeat protein [Clostridia bacterium]
MKRKKLIVLILLICIISIFAVILVGCDYDEKIVLNDYTVKYNGRDHAVIATNDINGDFTYRYVSEELDYDSEQAPIEVGRYTVIVSKEGYKTTECNLEITTDFLFDNNSNVVGRENSNDSVLYIPAKIKGKEVKEIKNLESGKTVKEIYLPNTIEKITALAVENETVVYLTSTPDINNDIDLSDIFFNIDNVNENIDPNYFANNKITRVDILGVNSSSIKAVENIVDTIIDTVYLREDSKLEKALPSNIKTVVVNYAYEIQNNFLVQQGLIENFILTTNEEIILVKSDSFINLTEVTNFIPSKNIYFSDPARELDEDILLNPDYYCCNNEQLPTIDKLIIEDDLNTVGKCQYLNVKCNEVVLPDTLIEVKLYGLSICTSNMILPDSLEIIGDRAFAYINIVELILPSNVKSIGYEAFANCFELDGDVVLPESLEYLGGGAFYNCRKLKKVIDNSQIETIEKESFAFCMGLQEYVFNNDKLERIGEAAFLGDVCLKYVELPNSLKYIESKAFWGAGSKSLIIPEGIIDIEGRAFWDMLSLKSNSPKYIVENGYLIRTEDKFLMNFDETSTTKKVIPEIDINGLCDEVYEWIIDRGQFEGSTLTINSSIKEYKYDKPIMEKGHIVIPEHVTEQPIFNVEVGGGFIYESAVPPKMPDTESLRMDGKEIIVPKGSIDAYKQAFSKYANADELIVKLVEAQ